MDEGETAIFKCTVDANPIRLVKYRSFSTFCEMIILSFCSKISFASSQLHL